MGSMPEHPDRGRADADEQRIGALLRAVEAPAPTALHQRIAAITAGHVASSTAGRRRRVRARAPSFAFAGAFAAAVALAIVLVAGTGSAAPTALAASRLALEPPTARAPAALVAAGTTIAFPHWSARGWSSVGTRSDALGGRTVTTEFYRSWKVGTLGYAIVSGPPLRWGGGGHDVGVGGADYRVMSAAGARIVTWVQAGHTCVLASRTASSATLVALAVAQDRSSPV
jgi:hypothetical protein